MAHLKLSPFLAGFLANQAATAVRPHGGLLLPGRTDDRGFLRAQQPYRGGQITEHNSHWQPQLSSADNDLVRSWPLLPARVRDLVRNDPAMVNTKGVLVDNLVAQGIRSFANVTVDDIAQTKYNRQSNQGFERWAEEEADVEGRESFYEIEGNMMGEAIEVGNALLMQCLDNSPGRSIPLCYQQIEWEQLDRSLDRAAGPQGGKIVNGIEYDLAGRVKYYHVLDAHPYDQYSGWTTKSTPIPAARMLHWFVPFRPSASSGVSWLVAVVQPSRDSDQLIENELTAGVIGNQYTLVQYLSGGDPGGLGLTDGAGVNGGRDSYGNPLLRMGKGLVQIVDADKNEKIEAFESKRPGANVAHFSDFMNGRMAMGARLSKIRLTRDYSNTSWTSARGAHLDDQATFIPIQRRFGRSIVRPVRKLANRYLVARGYINDITADQYFNALSRWETFLIQLPGREQLNPVDETEGAAARLRIGITTHQAECAARGLNSDEVLEQLSREVQRIEDLGLAGIVNWSKGGGAPEQANAGQKSLNTVDPDGKPQPTKSGDNA